MRVLKTAGFARWARKQRLEDTAIVAAVEEMHRGLIDADLGGGLLKKRVARRGGGKRGGYRVFAATNRRERWIILLGFAKNEHENLSDDELHDLRLLARHYLAMSEAVLLEGVANGQLQETSYGEP